MLLNATIFSSGCFISYKSFVLTVEEIQLWRGSGVVEKKISKKFSKNWDKIHLIRFFSLCTMIGLVVEL